MKRYAAEQLRNVAIVAHGGAGKTSLMEALLYVAGATERQGRVEDGNTVSDYDPEEIRRKMSIHAAIASAEWDGAKINFIDVPGYADFVGEVAGAVRAADGAIFVAAAQSGGVDVGFEVAWEYAVKESLARAVFINKMDKENADFFRVVDKLRARYGKVIAAAEIPIGSGATFHGVVDLIHLKAYTFFEGEKIDHPDGIPDDLTDVVQQYREQLIESAAEFNDELLEKYLSGEELTNEEIERGLHDGMSLGKVAPVLCGAATKDMGVRVLLDLIRSEFPKPGEHAPRHGADPRTEQEIVRQCKDEEPFSAQVFKTVSDPYVGKLTYFRVYSGLLKSDSSVLNVRTGHEERIGQLFMLRGKQQIPVTEIAAGDVGAVGKLAETRTSDTLADKAKPIRFDPIEFPQPMFTVAVSAKTKADEDKLGTALHRLEEENPTFSLRRDAETGQTLLTGVGEAQIDILVDRLKRFGAQVQTSTPRVPYRETVQAKVKAEGKHKKQTGGRGQFGDCWIELEPAERGAGFVFVDAVVGGAIPRQYIPAVKNGICEAMARGIIAGNPVVDVKATVYDGKFHDVDSSEAAFKIAGSLAFQNAATIAKPVLLEPVMKVSVTVPEAYMGDVMGDLNTRRGRVLGMERVEGADGSVRQRVNASIPQGELLSYAIELRSLTHGRGSYTAEFSHYEEAPQHVEQEVVKEAVKNGFSIHVEH
ncbi:MAG: elongation factor G [Capsulimonadaceae bacterium]|nr:elongation factor G [Capsulimonadaceae bacterium]